MQDFPSHRQQQLGCLLLQLTQAHRDISTSVARLSCSMTSLSQNLDWVDGRFMILDEDQERRSRPEAALTAAIEEAGPDLMATLKLQRSQLKERSNSLTHRSLQDWLTHDSHETI